MNFEERHWERLLADIHARQVIPVIGPELAIFKVDGKPVTLYRYLANQLVERLELNTKDLPPAYGFYHVINEFLAQQQDHPKRYERDELYYQFCKMMEERAWPTPEPLKQLAAITNLDLFVSTTFDALMEQALNEVRYGGKLRCRTYAYGMMEKVEDLPYEFRAEERATVFQYFGKLNPLNDFAVGDEDIAEYTHRLQSLDFKPRNIFEQFRNKRLLILGCSFPNWLTRLFLMTVNAAGGSVGISGVLADRLSSQDRELVRFLERKRINVYSQGDAAMFVAELHERWMAKFGNTEMVGLPVPDDELPTDMTPDSVFVSFCREDREIAREIVKRFRDAGIAVWFDETNLAPGDCYKSKIEEHIFECFAFVPLISKASISNDPQPLFYRFEWRKAIEAALYRYNTSKFIYPLLVDDTAPKDDAIPDEFRKLYISPLADLDRLIVDINTHIRQLRRESRILPEIEKILSPPVHSESTSAPEIEIRITPDPESERTFLPVVEKRSAPKIEVTSASGTIPIEDALAFQLGPTNFSGSIGQPAEVFICYRRDDTEDATARIWDVLSEEFGSMKVFRDVDSIPPGVDFRIHIRNILANCRVVLVIIGRDWINQTDQDGKRRLDDSDDHVRIELEAALARNNLPVVPVLVRRAEFPDKKLLPDSIKSLALRSGMTIRSDQHFRDDVEKLVRYLNEDLGVKSARSES